MIIIVIVFKGGVGKIISFIYLVVYFNNKVLIILIDGDLNCLVLFWVFYEKLDFLVVDEWEGLKVVCNYEYIVVDILV